MCGHICATDAASRRLAAAGGPKGLFGHAPSAPSRAKTSKASALLRKRRGWDSNPRDRSRGLAVFKTAPFNRSGTPPERDSSYALAAIRRGAPYSKSGSGTAKEVSLSWKFSMIARSQRAVTAVPFSVWTGSGPRSARKRTSRRRAW